MNINEKKVKRLELYHRSIDAAYQHLKDVQYSDDNDKVFMALKSLLDLIFSADEMHFSPKYHVIKDNDNDGKYLNGLRYAANLLKHEKICFEVHQLNTTPLIRFPLVIPEEGIQMGVIQTEWIKVDTLPNSKRENDLNFIKQKQIYNECLVGKVIFHAIDLGIKFLNKEKEKFIKK